MNLIADLIKTPIRIAVQGAVRVDNAHIFRHAEGIVCIYLGLHSKYAVVEASSSPDDGPPSIYIAADEHTLFLDESKPRDMGTEVEFVDFVGGRVFAIEVSRYTVSVCLVAPLK